MTIRPVMVATYQVGLGSFALAASTACSDFGGFFGLRRFDSGIRCRIVVGENEARPGQVVN